MPRDVHSFCDTRFVTVCYKCTERTRTFVLADYQYSHAFFFVVRLSSNMVGTSNRIYNRYLLNLQKKKNYMCK